MKKLFIHAKVNLDIDTTNAAKALQDKKAGLLTTIQHLHVLPQIQKQIPHSILGGQILGCNIEPARKIADKVDCFLYIGTGRFHPLAIAYELEKEVLTLDPLSGKINEIKKQDIEKFRKKKKAAYMKFLVADTIGILVTTKEGQKDFAGARGLKKELEKSNNKFKTEEKRCYLLIADYITPNEIENFPFIDCFVNTACPRIFEDDFKRPIINLRDLEDPKF